MLEKITSLQNPRIKKAIRLHSSRGRQNQNRMIVFGEREVTRALESGVAFEELFFEESFVPDRLSIPLIEKNRTGLFSLPTQLFEKIGYGDRADGVVGVAIRPSSSIDQLSIPSNSLVVVVEAIEKPGNLGAIVRTADACGVSAVLLADPITDFFHPNSIRSSTGTVFGMPVASGASADVQAWLAQNDLSVYTAMLHGATDFFHTKIENHAAIVLGNEAKGLSDAWNQPEYHPVKLPMCGRADSLNVSVTASVMIYEAKRQNIRKNIRQ